MTFEEMKKIVVDTLNCDEDKVTMEASLTEDLEADSLDAVELNMALGVANRILMLENAVYSVLSPEGFASILWKDSSRSGEACEMMKLTAQDLYRGGIVEQVIPEPVGGAQRGHAALFETLDEALRANLRDLCRMSGRALADQRYKKYRQIGETRNP